MCSSKKSSKEPNGGKRKGITLDQFQMVKTTLQKGPQALEFPQVPGKHSFFTASSFPHFIWLVER